MSQSGYTPIQLYRTTTAAAVPTAGNLAAGELAINLTDEALYFKNAAGVVTLLADSSGALGSVTSVNVSGGTTGLTTSGGPITSSGTITLAGTVAVTNGGTGATTLSSGYLVKGNGTSAVSASVVYDTGTNVGIGTSSPSIRLQVSDVDQAAARIGVNNVNGQNYHLVAGNPGASNSGFAIFDATAAATRMYLDSSGNVGIGTSSPGAKLAVAGGQINTVADEAYGIALNATTGNARVIPYAATYSGSVLVSYSAGYAGYGPFSIDASRMQFWTNGNERMRIDSSGNVGVGTSSPSSFGRFAVQTNGGSGVGFELYSPSTTNGARMRLADNYSAVEIKSIPVAATLSSDMGLITNGAERMRIDSSGNVGIGTTPSAWATYPALQIAGGGVMGAGSELNLSANSYFNAGWKRIATGAATLYNQAAGVHSWFNATSDAAGTAISLNERMRIDASGNVGIGTTAPAGKLEVASTDAITTLFVDTENVGVSAGNYSQVALADTGTIRTWWRNVRDGSGKTAFGYNNHLAFLSDAGGTPTERMRITSAGNVGIGTTAPGGPLQVKTSGGQWRIETNGTGTKMVGVNAANNAEDIITMQGSPITFFSNGSERARIDSSGNLLVGTTTADNRLTVSVSSSGAAASVASLVNPNDGAGTAADLDFVTHSSGTLATGRIRGVAVGADDYALAFSSYGSGGIAERMRITGSGDVAIGTTGLAYSFSGRRVLGIDGTNSSLIEMRSGGTQRGYIIGDANTIKVAAAGSNTLQFETNGAERARFDTSGNLLVGTTTAPVSGTSGVQLAPLFVRIGAASTSNTGLLSFNNPNGEVGLVTVSGTATAYNTSSDYRLKEIDGPIVNSGAYIDALKPVQGSWKADGSRFIGLLAHEVQEVSETPIATGEKDGEKMQAMDYSAPELIANLIAEIQSLRARVAQLEGN